MSRSVRVGRRRCQGRHVVPCPSRCRCRPGGCRRSSQARWRARMLQCRRDARRVAWRRASDRPYSAGLDACGLVHLVAETGDLGACRGGDGAHEHCRCPVQTEPQRQLVGFEVRASCDVGERRPDRVRGGDARERGVRFRCEAFDREERDHAITHVTADQPTGINDALVGRADDSPDQRRVACRRETACECRRTLKIGEHHSAGPTPGT